MDKIVINPSTSSALDDFIERPSQAVGIVGVNGSGKKFLADWLISKILEISLEKVSTYPYRLSIAPVDDSISIDEIRTIQNFLKLKTPRDNRLIRRVVLIEHADDMTHAAQNALLKQLEEPPDDTLFILTLDSVYGILSTVLSRLTIINVHKPSKSQLAELFSENQHTKDEIDKAYLITGGLIGFMKSLLEEDETAATAIKINEIKDVLRMKRLDRLLSADKLYVDKEDLKRFVQIMIQISQGTIIQTASKNDDQSLLRWKKILSISYEAKVALLKNAQPKLVFMDLLINL